VRFEFLVVVTVTAVTWDIILCTLSEVCTFFRGSYPVFHCGNRTNLRTDVRLVVQGSGRCIRSKTTEKDYRSLRVVIELHSVWVVAPSCWMNLCLLCTSLTF